MVKEDKKEMLLKNMCVLHEKILIDCDIRYELSLTKKTKNSCRE